MIRKFVKVCGVFSWLAVASDMVISTIVGWDLFIYIKHWLGW